MKFLNSLTKETVYIPIIIVLSFLYKLLYYLKVVGFEDLWGTIKMSFNISLILSMKIIIVLLIIKALYLLIKRLGNK